MSRFDWGRFDALPVAVKAVAWDWGWDVRFEALAGRGAPAAAVRADVERRRREAAQKRRVRVLAFSRFVPMGRRV